MHRNAVSREAHKTQRWMADPSRLEETAATQYKRIRNVNDILYMYSAIGGGATEADPNRRAHFLPDVNNTAPPGSCSRDLIRHDVFGGFHPYSPEFCLNALRADGLPLAAGLLNANGVKIKVNSSQLDYRSYRPEGRMCHHLPAVCHRRNAFHVLANVHRTNPFDRDLPFELHGQLRPGDNLVSLFWDMYKDKDANLIAARRRPLTEENLPEPQEDGDDLFMEDAAQEQEEEAVEPVEPMADEPEAEDSWKDFTAEIITAISNLVNTISDSSAQLAKSVLDSFAVGQDTLDLSSDERQKIKSGAMHFSKTGADIEMEPRQAIKVMSQAMGRIFDFVNEWKTGQDGVIAEARRIAPLKKAADMAVAKREPCKALRHIKINTINNTDYDAEADELERQTSERHCLCMRDLVQLSLLHFKSNFTSRRQREDIPPGWVDAYDQFDKILYDVQKLSEPGFQVDPDHTNASVGTASLGYLFNLDLLSLKVSPHGAWRKILVQLFSRTARVTGREVRIMLNGWLHTFEAFMPVSYLYIVCGDAGLAAANRTVPIARLAPPRALCTVRRHRQVHASRAAAKDDARRLDHEDGRRLRKGRHERKMGQALRAHGLLRRGPPGDEVWHRRRPPGVPEADALGQRGSKHAHCQGQGQ
jgi:hypothetical protein